MTNPQSVERRSLHDFVEEFSPIQKRSSVDKFTTYRESLVKKYSELGRTIGADLSKTQWGVGVNPDGNLLGLYNNEDLINTLYTRHIFDHLENKQTSNPTTLAITDFGGGEGFVLTTVQNQLEELGYSSRGTNVDLTTKSLIEMRKQTPNEVWGTETLGVRANLSSLPLKSPSVDVGLSRYVLQYFPLERQADILRSMWATMNKNSILVMQLPWAMKSREQAENFNQFVSQIEAAINSTTSAEVLAHRYYPSLEDVEEMIAGLTDVQNYNLRSVAEFQWLVTPEAYTERFRLGGEKSQIVHDLFQQETEKQMRTTEIVPGYIKFQIDGGSYLAAANDALVILKKM